LTARREGSTVTAQYATSVFNGKNVTSKRLKPKFGACSTPAEQADGKENRNILLSE